MPTSRPSRFSVWITAGLAAAFVVWTWLVTGGVLDDLDRRTVAKGLAPGSLAAEIWSAIAIVTWPGVPYAGLAIVGVWAFRRRLRNLAYALWLAVPVGWGAHIAVKAVFARPRPDAVLELATGRGWAYPSGHVTTATVVAVLVISAVIVTRQSKVARMSVLGLGVAAVVTVAVCRWVLQAHWVSDLIGGVLLGMTVSAACLVVARVRVLPDRPWELALPPSVRPTGKQCVVIFNPTKVLDVTTFRRHVEYELRKRGWEPPLWLETTRSDPGYQMAELAVKQEADLVLTAGGDGTIRAVCEGLAGSGIPLGLLPAGTGNLLARNLGVPLDESLALRTAFDGEPRPTDLVKLTIDPGTEREHSHVFGVMAGIGVDAAIMQHTNPELKRTVGPAAYLLAAAQNANHPALPVTVSVDNAPPFKRKAAVVLIGNVGVVTGNIELIPGADAMDGQLDVMIASPRTVADWARLTAKVLTRRRGDDDRMDLLQGSRVRIESDRVDAYQVDGDTEGTCSVLEAEVLPGVLMVMGARAD